MYVNESQVVRAKWSTPSAPGVYNVEKAALASRIREAQTSPERATRLLPQILDFKRQSSQHDLVDRRKALRDLHPGLHATYIKTR